MIRKAQITDAEQILNIYSYYIEHTAITFEYDIPSIEEFRGRIENTLEKYPYLKCAYKFGRWYDMVWMEKFIGEHGLFV